MFFKLLHHLISIMFSAHLTGCSIIVGRAQIHAFSTRQYSRQALFIGTALGDTHHRSTTSHDASHFLAFPVSSTLFSALITAS